MKNNILITGAAGFIGTNFIYHWLKNNPEDNIIGLDALTYAGVEKNLDLAKKSSNFKFIKCNINDNEQLPEIFNINCINKVVHFAAESHVDRSIQDPELFLRTNILGTFNLLNNARKFWNENQIKEHHFHHISTDEVYGDLSPNESSFTEKNQYLPNSPYAASKASSDHLVYSYVRTYKIPAIITNCSNNYGPKQHPEKLIPKLIYNITNNKNLPIYGKGTNSREWLHVSDHCRALLAVFIKGKDGEFYNIGSNKNLNNIQITKMLIKIAKKIIRLGKNVKIKYIMDRPGHDKRYALDSNKIKKQLKWKPLINLEAGLTDTFLWYLNNGNYYSSFSKKDISKRLGVKR